MGLKPDHWIRKMAHEHRMIEPFEEKQVRNGVVSYGVSSYGYDVRVADEFKIFTNVFSATVDPKNFDTKSMVDYIGDVCTIPPNSFALARTVEYFRIPRKVLTICLGKSTYARCGIISTVTIWHHQPGMSCFSCSSSAICECFSLVAPALSSAPNQPAQSLPVLALTAVSLMFGT